MTIGERIKKYRQSANLTQENLAGMLHISSQAVSKWECGATNPDLLLIEPLTRIFHITADELLGINEFAIDEKRQKYDNAHQIFRQGGNPGSGYWWAKEATITFPDDYSYLEWLAYTEYQLAFAENQKPDASLEYFNELTESALRHYELIIDKTTDPDIYSKAVFGKIMLLRFLDRIDEAEWSAEFEYPDINVKSAEGVLSLCEDGKMLLDYLKNE